MSSLSRNSCEKAFGNWSSGKHFRLKKPRGGGRGSTNPPLPASLRVMCILCHCKQIYCSAFLCYYYEKGKIIFKFKMDDFKIGKLVKDLLHLTDVKRV